MLLSIIFLLAAAELHAAVIFGNLARGVARPLAPPPRCASCELEACPAASAFSLEHIHPHGGGVCTMPSSSLLASLSLDASLEEQGMQVPILASPASVAPRALAPGGVVGKALPHFGHPLSYVGAGYAFHQPSTSPTSVPHTHASSGCASRALFSSRVRVQSAVAGCASTHHLDFNFIPPLDKVEAGAGSSSPLASFSLDASWEEQGMHVPILASPASVAPRALAPGGVVGEALPHIGHPLSQPWLVKYVGAGRAFHQPSTSPTSVPHTHASSSCASRAPFGSRVRVQSAAAGCASTHHLDFNFIPPLGRVEAGAGGSVASGHLLLVSDVDASVMGALALVRVSPVLPSSDSLVLSPIRFGGSLEPGCFDLKGSSSWLAHFDYDLLMHRRRVLFSPLSLARGSFVVSVGRCVTTSSSLLMGWLSSQVLPGLCRGSGGLGKMSVLLALFYANLTCAMSAVVAGDWPSGFIILISWSTTTMVLFKQGGGVLTSLSWVLPRLGGRALFWVAIFSRFVVGSCVCLSCAGNDPNCKGDDTCIMAKALKANAMVMAGTVGAATVLSMGEEGKHILPLPWLQFLKPSVLLTLVRLAQRAPTGTPVDITGLTIKELSASIRGGSISVSDGRFEFLRRMTEDGVAAEEMTKIKMICEILPQSDESKLITPFQRLSNSGALQFVFALASQVVLKLSGASKITLSVGDSSSSSTSTSSSISVELKRPTSLESFFYSLTVWQTLLSATGLSNSVVIGPFLAEVVHDVVPLHGWRVAFEHFLLYIQKIDSGCGWQLGNATSLGSHDTFLHKAVRAAGDTSPAKPPVVRTPGTPGAGGDNPPLVKPPRWNGKFTAASPRPCAAFNLGQEHVRLGADGTCLFNHVCDQWVTDQGKNGRCKGAHSRNECTNPAKTQNKSE